MMMAVVMMSNVNACTQSITLSPNSGFSCVTIVGSDFDNNKVITIYWNDVSQPFVSATGKTDSSGNFVVIISIPTTTAGLYTIKATVNGDSASATFTVISMVGATGATGQTGATGSQGEQGAQGIQGEQGIQGATGLTGAVGHVGKTGLQGIAGVNGTNGTNGTNGKDGATGLTGAMGATGSQGATGATGQSGATGATGSQGAIGSQGKAGTNGTDGINGAGFPLWLSIVLVVTAIAVVTLSALAYRKVKRS